jgi:AraC-like DNA-binding protein
MVIIQLKMFAPITLGPESWSGRTSLPRHQHRAGYACLVLKGGYEEAGDCGHFRMSAGDVVFHKPFESHLDRISAKGAQTINFRLDGWSAHPVDVATSPDPDLIARLVERNITEAREALLATIAAKTDNCIFDWPDDLARSIRKDPRISLSRWSAQRGVAPTALSRGFRRIYQVSPNTFRAQMRARHAWRSIVDKRGPLSIIALESGFSDQAHMTRGVGALTGRTPGEWRASAAN